jgi:hypothetical protein
MSWFKLKELFLGVYYHRVEQKRTPLLAIPVNLHLPNPQDEPFLEVAFAAKTVPLATGNKRHFLKKEYEDTKMSSSAEFLEVFGGESDILSGS